jgi:hypothetical protein
VVAPSPAAHVDQLVEVALPSVDTGRGLAGGYERRLAGRNVTYALRGELRESASGDYTGIRVGVGAEVRWFWRAPHAAWLTVLPPGSLAGWYLAAGSYAAADATHADTDHRWLGTTFELGGVARIGYRIAPWRGLAITPSAGLEIQRELDVSGRLAGVTRGGVAFGLDVGWMF